MTAYTFTNPKNAAIDLVESLIAGRSETYLSGATVSAKFPTAGTPKHVQVEWDGTPVVAYPVTERAAVRVTCWLPKGQRSNVIDMAGVVQGLLLNESRGSSDLLAIYPGGGRLPGTDPATGFAFCTFTVRASTKPSAVA